MKRYICLLSLVFICVSCGDTRTATGPNDIIARPTITAPGAESLIITFTADELRAIADRMDADDYETGSGAFAVIEVDNVSIYLHRTGD